jgi:predicted ATPase
MGHTHSYVHALVRETEVHLLRGDGQAALEDLAIVTKLSEEKGFPMWLAAGQFFRGHALRLTGQVEKGIEEMREGVRRTLETGAQVMYPEYVAGLAEALGEAGRAEEALALIDDGLQMVGRTTAGLFEAELYRLRAELAMGSSGPRPDQAREHARQALDLAQRRGAGAWERRALETMGRL